MNSKFVTKLEFVKPDQHNAIPTYRIMDQDGNIVDDSKIPTEDPKEIISWYKNMLSG